MRRFFLVALVVAIRLDFATCADDASKTDLKKLQGKWEIVSLVVNGERQIVNGKKVDPTDSVKDVWSIAGNKVKYPSETEDEIKLDATRTPKVMEIKSDREGEIYKLEAIYAIDADTLKICVDAEKKGRPA